ncbi:MAG: hypothetical protein GXO66_06580 [Euryarchaeota archaeon]|nr:hypothetical protein [Euryarchaeota archaeon]
MYYLKLRVNQALTRRRLCVMLTKLRPAVLKLESTSARLNNRTIRYALELGEKGFSIREVRLFARYKGSRGKGRKHHLIAVTLAYEAQRGRLKRSEPRGDEAEVKEVRRSG